MSTPKVIIPFIWIYTLFGLASLFVLPNNWWYTLLFFLIFVFGNGTVAHRYFSHKSFKVARPVHWLLAFWVTITGYSPIAYWMVQHMHHHRHTDSPNDVHSPANGFFKSFFLWTVDKDRVESIFRERSSIALYISCMRDPAIKFFNTYFIPVNILLLVTLGLLELELLYSIGSAYVLEQIRLGILNTALHAPSFPFSYRNHPDVDDRSQNNYILGILTFGFGWHNNHHKSASKLILTERWWEIDFEGYLGWLLSLTYRGKDDSYTR
jgi:stearoyl-CoA desaturase (Delta-9 desaturase)